MKPAVRERLKEPFTTNYTPLLASQYLFPVRLTNPNDTPFSKSQHHTKTPQSRTQAQRCISKQDTQIHKKKREHTTLLEKQGYISEQGRDISYKVAQNARQSKMQSISQESTGTFQWHWYISEYGTDLSQNERQLNIKDTAHFKAEHDIGKHGKLQEAIKIPLGCFCAQNAYRFPPLILIGR